MRMAPSWRQSLEEQRQDLANILTAPYLIAK